MRLEVLGEPVDALGQERDLDLGGPGVPFMRLELFDQALLAVESKRHREDLLQSPVPETHPQAGSKHLVLSTDSQHPTTGVGGSKVNRSPASLSPWRCRARSGPSAHRPSRSAA